MNNIVAQYDFNSFDNVLGFSLSRFCQSSKKLETINFAHIDLVKCSKEWKKKTLWAYSKKKFNVLVCLPSHILE